MDLLGYLSGWRRGFSKKILQPLPHPHTPPHPPPKRLKQLLAGFAIYFCKSPLLTAKLAIWLGGCLQKNLQNSPNPAAPSQSRCRCADPGQHVPDMACYAPARPSPNARARLRWLPRAGPHARHVLGQACRQATRLTCHLYTRSVLKLVARTQRVLLQNSKY